jgi:hypothetical protein
LCRTQGAAADQHAEQHRCRQQDALGSAQGQMAQAFAGCGLKPGAQGLAHRAVNHPGDEACERKHAEFVKQFHGRQFRQQLGQALQIRLNVRTHRVSRVLLVVEDAF